MKKNVITQIKELLGMEVKLEQMKLADGTTVLEADSFDPEMEVFIVTSDEQKIALPVGEYELEDGRILVVEVEGIIKEVKDVAEETEMPEVPSEEVPTEASVEASTEVATPKKTIESIVKESFFSEMEALKKENEELKAQLSAQTNEVAEEEVAPVELSEEPKPIAFNPENTKPVETFKFATSRQRSTLDSIFDKLNK